MVSQEGGSGLREPGSQVLFFPPLCSFMSNTNPSTDALTPFEGGSHAMCFRMEERAGGRHRLSTCLYICHTVAVLRQESLFQLAFLLTYVYASKRQPNALSSSAITGRPACCSTTLFWWFWYKSVVKGEVPSKINSTEKEWEAWKWTRNRTNKTNPAIGVFHCKTGGETTHHESHLIDAVIYCLSDDNS